MKHNRSVYTSGLSQKATRSSPSSTSHQCPLQSPTVILQALKRPHWCCWPSGKSQHTSAFAGCTPINNRCQWPYPWLRWWHCCRLLSTLWGIYSSSPAPLHRIWESPWSLDCPDSNRWTPEEDAPSSDQVMGGFPQQKQCVLREPRSRRSPTAECPSLRVSGGSARSANDPVASSS